MNEPVEEKQIERMREWMKRELKDRVAAHVRAHERSEKRQRLEPGELVALLAARGLITSPGRRIIAPRYGFYF